MTQSKKKIWLIGSLVSACALCCALPILGLTSLGLLSASSLWLLDKGEAIVCAVGIATLCGFIILKIRAKQQGRKEACHMDCACKSAPDKPVNSI